MQNSFKSNRWKGKIMKTQRRNVWTFVLVIDVGNVAADRYYSRHFRIACATLCPRPYHPTARSTGLYFNDVNFSLWIHRRGHLILLVTFLQNMIGTLCLWTAIIEEWQNLSQELVDNIIISMHRRVETVFYMRSRWTKYVIEEYLNVIS